ncbi:MAG: phosphoheptose isomerase [Verrucomicrobia bacterium]|nr:phosphoheptose isomerase [Cytophagales bacterium]
MTQFSDETDKETVFEAVAAMLSEKNLTFINKDDKRPWGGFFVLDESQSEDFIKAFFSHLSLEDFSQAHKLSPKILIVAPEKRLSWQYHFRRAEIWKVLSGTVGIKTSFTDEEQDLQTLQPGDIVELAQGQRHRLIGLESWGILAEIWQHTDPEDPSDENDIVRVQDDFGR